MAIWGASNLVIIPFVFFFVPETKGRSLEQLDEMFAKRVPTLKFKGFVTEHVPIDAERDPVHAIAESRKEADDTVIIENTDNGGEHQ